MNMKKPNQELIDRFASQVSAHFDDPESEDFLLYEESDFHGLTCGWAMAQGMSPTEAYDFATYIRHNTDLA